MKRLQLKTKISTIALILLLTLSATLVALPAVNAQTPGTTNTFAIIDFIPNPAGVNQQILITFGITAFTTRPQTGWEGLTIEITKPDGTTEILGPLKTDTTGLSGATYVPTQVGTYILQTHFPEQTVTAEEPGRTKPVGEVMLASSSEAAELIVQDTPIEYYPEHSLPNEYWARPIDSQIREWSRIAGNWLWGKSEDPAKFAPYNEFAPETFHILWTKPITDGGLSGGQTGNHGISCGDAYEGIFEDSVIVGGVLFYNRFARGFAGMQFQQGIVAVDLHTGEELWFRNNTRLWFAQSLFFDSFNHHAVYNYLWEIEGSTWNAYDVATGEWFYSFENVPGGLRTNGPNGEILIYTVNTEDGRMSRWNSTKAGQSELTVEGDFGSWGRMVEITKTFDASTPQCFDWDITIPLGLPGGASMILDDRIIGSNTGGSTAAQQPNPKFWAISTAPGTLGQLLWNKDWALPIEDLHVFTPAGFLPNLEDRVFLVAAKETRNYYGFSIDTGNEIWGPTESLPPLTAFSIVYPSGNVWGQGLTAYGKLLVGGMGGEVACYNVKTGEHLWSYFLTDPYQEVLWSNYWPAVPVFITDGKVYVAHTEHSVIDPKFRGAPFVCLDMETGDEIFRVDGVMRTTRWGGQHIIGDSIIAGFDSYDNRIYAIGKGPSATTLSTPDVGVPIGSSVTIKGMVTDVSPGTKESALQMRFPNGVPAVSDDIMGDWMKYVFKQFERPANVQGVTVKLEAVDPNGNYQILGTTITDAYGNYGFRFKPEVEGQYMIIATFEGSESYYGSTTTTYLSVDPAPSPAVPIEPEPLSEAPLITTEVAIIAAVAVAAVIAIVGYLVIKKRK